MKRNRALADVCITGANTLKRRMLERGPELLQVQVQQRTYLKTSRPIHKRKKMRTNS